MYMHACLCIHTKVTDKTLYLASFCRFPGYPPKLKPMVVDLYNKYMLGVDRLDQRMSYYQFVRKSVRWWRKVFFWMVEVVVVNSYIVYTIHTDARRKLTHKQFRRELVLALCEEQQSSLASHRSRHRRDQTLERLRGSHFPDTAATRWDCRVCSVRGPDGQRHLTTSYCSTCSDRPHLCIGDCFRKYHTQAHL